MFRALRLSLMLLLPVLAIGVPFGYALGSFATGDAPPVRMAGYTAPDQGTNLRSVASADAFQPAAVSYASDRTAAAGFAY